jgi:hypothetical protein
MNLAPDPHSGESLNPVPDPHTIGFESMIKKYAEGNQGKKVKSVETRHGCTTQTLHHLE